MLNKEYLDKIKDKYDIHHIAPRSQYITREEYLRNLENLKHQIRDLYSKEIVPEIMAECQNYKILEIWEDPLPNVYIKCLMIYSKNRNRSKFISKQGNLIKSDPLYVYIGSPEKPIQISRCNLILTKYTDGEMELINLQGAINSDL